MKDINLTLFHCQEFHPFTQAKRKLATHEEEERKEKWEGSNHNFYLENKGNYNKRNKDTNNTRKCSWSLNQDDLNELPTLLFIED